MGYPDPIDVHQYELDINILAETNPHDEVYEFLEIVRANGHTYVYASSPGQAICQLSAKSGLGAYVNDSVMDWVDAHPDVLLDHGQSLTAVSADRYASWLADYYVDRDLSDWRTIKGETREQEIEDFCNRHGLVVDDFHEVNKQQLRDQLKEVLSNYGHGSLINIYVDVTSEAENDALEDGEMSDKSPNSMNPHEDFIGVLPLVGQDEVHRPKNEEEKLGPPLQYTLPLDDEDVLALA